ncbi:unnamed protein product [Lactuca saligna]|uniref:Uncharacterized protein n=1 Tax=Lactuca saligna TaxID=75948 RepID=A0AA35UX47_LACSI|nr:unnamed protein product [Lactuca saligna]
MAILHKPAIAGSPLAIAASFLTTTLQKLSLKFTAFRVFSPKSLVFHPNHANNVSISSILLLQHVYDLRSVSHLQAIISRNVCTRHGSEEIHPNGISKIKKKMCTVRQGDTPESPFIVLVDNVTVDLGPQVALDCYQRLIDREILPQAWALATHLCRNSIFMMVFALFLPILAGNAYYLRTFPLVPY